MVSKSNNVGGKRMKVFQVGENNSFGVGGYKIYQGAGE